uniref:Uncharacterized protein n=1 Tax=Timema cristinae TaxID=61476 RepID=A0A7R9C9U7_TIMCR|nr:unnamed protein product [Timema cristinae]
MSNEGKFCQLFVQRSWINDLGPPPIIVRCGLLAWTIPGMDSLQVAQSESSKSSSRSTSPCRPFAGSHSSHHLTTTTTSTTAVVTSAPHTPHITAPQNVSTAQALQVRSQVRYPCSQFLLSMGQTLPEYLCV